MYTTNVEMIGQVKTPGESTSVLTKVEVDVCHSMKGVGMGIRPTDRVGYNNCNG